PQIPRRSIRCSDHPRPLLPPPLPRTGGQCSLSRQSAWVGPGWMLRPSLRSEGRRRGMELPAFTLPPDGVGILADLGGYLGALGGGIGPWAHQEIIDCRWYARALRDQPILDAEHVAVSPLS